MWHACVPEPTSLLQYSAAQAVGGKHTMGSVSHERLRARADIHVPRLGAVGRRPPAEGELGAVAVELREALRGGQLDGPARYACSTK